MSKASSWRNSTLLPVSNAADANDLGERRFRRGSTAMPCSACHHVAMWASMQSAARLLALGYTTVVDRQWLLLHDPIEHMHAIRCRTSPRGDDAVHRCVHEMDGSSIINTKSCGDLTGVQQLSVCGTTCGLPIVVGTATPGKEPETRERPQHPGR